MEKPELLSKEDYNLIHKDISKKLLSTNGSGRTNEVMAEIYGMKVAKDLVHISGDTSDYHLEGFVAKPEHLLKPEQSRC